MSFLTREQVLSADDLPRAEVDCPEWGGAVLVRALTAHERVEMARRAMNSAGEMDAAEAMNLLIVIPAIGVIDEHGKRVFSEADLTALGEKNGEPLKRIMDKIQELSKITESTGVEALKKA